MLAAALAIAFTVASAFAAPAAHAASAGVAIVRASTSPLGDSVREGAGEFEVLFCVARLEREHPAAGIVGVGDRCGLFLEGTERALHFVALQGVPVARIAPHGDFAADPDGLFLDAGDLSESAAAALLQSCLERLGPPPVAADPDRPTAGELAAIRAHLLPFREAFEAARLRIAQVSGAAGARANPSGS